jgi:hypothetical protein
VRVNRRGVGIVKGISNFQLPEISSRLDPIRYHGNISSPEKFIGISVSSSKDGDVSSLSELFLLGSDCNGWGPAQLGLLEYLSKVLHTLLIANDSMRGGTDYDVSNATPEALR